MLCFLMRSVSFDLAEAADFTEASLAVLTDSDSTLLRAEMCMCEFESHNNMELT